MISVLVVTHGHLGEELLKCAEGVIGKQPGVRILGLEPAEGPDGFDKKVKVILEELNNPAGVLVMVDMMGGTPCNVAMRQCRDPRFHYEIVTGVNMPMLVSALTNRHYMPLAQLAQKLVDDVARNVVRPMERLRDSMKNDPS